VQAKALFDYVTEVAGELCFNTDDVLLITNQVFFARSLSVSLLHGIFTSAKEVMFSSALACLLAGLRKLYLTDFYCATQICIARTCYGNVAGWVAGCLSQPVLYQND